MSPGQRPSKVPHYFYCSVTRNSDLWHEPFQVELLDRAEWSTGDFVVGRVTGERNRLYLCETRSGRMAGISRGDLMVGALGMRAATLEGVGDWRQIGVDLEMEALTSAGLFGKGTSMSPMLPDLVRMDYQGHVTRDGRKLGMQDFVRTAVARPLDLPVIIVIGTSMSAGKTTSGQIIIRALKYLGQEVVAAKLSGAARYRDILSFHDAGATTIVDFVDAGLPSTVCPEEEFRPALDAMLNLIAAADADVAVIEVGASPLEPYNGSVVMEALRENLRLTVLCASDPYAVLGVRQAFAIPLDPLLVAGPAANTHAAVELVKKLTGLRALNLIDRASHPELLELLKSALG